MSKRLKTLVSAMLFCIMGLSSLTYASYDWEMEDRRLEVHGNGQG